MRVFVIMTNDYPAGVVSVEGVADIMCETGNRIEKERQQKQGGFGATVYWRHYEFELDNLDSMTRYQEERAK